MTQAITKPTQTRAQKLSALIVTLTKRLSDDTAKLAEVKLELETTERLSSVAPGTSIIARLGRAGSAAVDAVEARPESTGIGEDGQPYTIPAVAAVAAKAATEGTLRNVEATVLGVQELETGIRYKIAFGEGFDADTAIIQASQIVQINAAPETPSAAEFAPADVFGPAGELLVYSALSDGTEADQYGNPRGTVYQAG